MSLHYGYTSTLGTRQGAPAWRRYNKPIRQHIFACTTPRRDDGMSSSMQLAVMSDASLSFRHRVRRFFHSLIFLSGHIGVISQCVIKSASRLASSAPSLYNHDYCAYSFLQRPRTVSFNILILFRSVESRSRGTFDSSTQPACCCSLIPRSPPSSLLCAAIRSRCRRCL